MDFRSALRRYGDLLIAVVLTVVLTTEVALWDAADQARAIPAALLAALSLAVRRRLPLVAFVLSTVGIVAVLVFAAGFDNQSVGILAVPFLALYSLGRHTRGLEAAIGGLLVLADTVAFLIGDGPPIWSPSDIGFALGFVGGPWAVGLAIRLRREREQTLSARNVELQRDQEERARQAVSAERARLARELHDVVSHAISVTVLQARGGRRMIGTDDTQVRRAFDAIEHTNTQALGDMRRLLSLLRKAEDEPPMEPQPSLARLESLAQQVRDSGLGVQVSVHGAAADVPPGVDLSAYRIIQEALTNVLKHAGSAAEARVEVTYGERDLSILVSDDGALHTNGSAGGQGLIGIRERVAVTGRRVKAGPGELGGFVVQAWLPYAVDK
jgi:signal transduction histidine kinase